MNDLVTVSVIVVSSFTMGGITQWLLAQRTIRKQKHEINNLKMVVDSLENIKKSNRALIDDKCEKERVLKRRAIHICGHLLDALDISSDDLKAILDERKETEREERHFHYTSNPQKNGTRWWHESKTTRKSS